MKIISSMFVTLFLLGCSQESSQEQIQDSNLTQTNPQQKIIQSEVTSQAIPQTQPNPVLQENGENEKKELVEEKVSEVKEVVQEKVKEPLKEIKKDVTTAVTKSVPAVDGAVVYKACATCHGQNAEKQALNKSQIIQGWESSKTLAALQGYKDGTYGGPMKAMMKGQVSKLSDAEMKAVANHISGL